MALACGCVGTPQERAAKSLAAVKETANGALRTVIQLHHAGQVTDEEWFNFADLYNKEFTPAFTAAVRTARNDFDSLAPGDVLNILADLTATSREFKQRNETDG